MIHRTLPSNHHTKNTTLDNNLQAFRQQPSYVWQLMQDHIGVTWLTVSNQLIGIADTSVTAT